MTRSHRLQKLSTMMKKKQTLPKQERSLQMEASQPVRKLMRLKLQMNKMQIRKIALFIAGLFVTNTAFCQSEMLKSVVNNLAFYKQKGDFKYLGAAKKSVDSLVKTHADSIDLQKTVYRTLVNATILYADSTNKLKQPATLFDETVKLMDWSAKNKKIFRYQVELDFAKRCIANVYIRKGFHYLYNTDYYNALQLFQKAKVYTPD